MNFRHEWYRRRMEEAVEMLLACVRATRIATHSPFDFPLPIGRRMKRFTG